MKANFNIAKNIRNSHSVNVLCALRKLQSLGLLLCALLFGSLQMWGAVESGKTYTTKSTVPDGWEATTKGTNYCTLMKDAYIKTDEFCVSSITSIKLKARTVGGVDKSYNIITVYWIDTDNENAATSLGTVTPTSKTLTDITISPPASVTANHNGYIKIQCDGANSSKGSGVSEVTITYTAGSCGGGGPTTYSIYDNITGSGSLLYEEKAEEGDVVEVTITPYSEYYLSKFTVYNGDTWDEIDATRVDETHYSFVMPNADVTIYATFEALPSYSITYNTPTCVTSPSGTLTSQTYFATPSEAVPGYRFEGWVASAISGTTSSKPGTIYQPGEVIPSNNLTVYALYSQVSATFTRQTGSTLPVNDGNYMLVNAYSSTARVWKNEVDGNNRLTTKEWDCSGTTTNCTDWECIWVFKQGTGAYSSYWFIYNPQAGKYLGANSTTTSKTTSPVNYEVKLIDDMNDASAWTCSVSSGRITLVNKLRTANATEAQQKIFCSGNYAGFGYSSNTSPYFFKNDAVSASYTTNPTCPTTDHTITFNAKGGSGSMSPITDIEDGTSATLTSNTFSKDGYSFGGWTADVTVTIGDSPVSPGSTIANGATLQNITSDINLTAIWTPNPYRVDVASPGHVTIGVSSPSTIAEGGNANVNCGATVTLSQSGLESGYLVVWDVYKTGESSTKVSVTGSGNGATFVMPAYGVTVNVTITAPYIYFTSCGDDECNDKYCINSYKDGGNGMTCFTDQGSDVWTISNYAIPETGQSDRKAQNDFWVGYDGAWVSGKSGNWHFRWIPFKSLCGDYKLGLAPEAIGTLTINAATSGSDNNYELTFDPNGYGFVYGTDPSWETPLAFTRQGVSNVWNTVIVNVSDVISHSYYVGISKKGGGYVFSSDYEYNDDNEHIQGISQIQTINGVPVVSNTTSNPVAFRGSNLNATDGSNGMRGYFQIWTDNCNRNFYCHFVPVYTITYKSYDGSSTLYTEEVSAGESFTVRAAESGTLGWAESASQNAASVNYAAGATKTPTGDVTLYVACSAYTVSYTATSGTIQRDAVTISSDVVIAGNTVTLPTVTGCSLPCARFLGWYAGDYNNPSKPVFLAAGSSYTPSNDVTLKALYAIVGDNYELVTKASDLVVGSQVVISTRDWDGDFAAYFPAAMSETQGSGIRGVYNYSDSKVSIDAATGTIISWVEATPDVAEFTIEAGSSNGTYAFYGETVYDGSGNAASPGYIYCSSSSGSAGLGTQATKNADASWSITITDGVATMVSQKDMGSWSTKRNVLMYNYNSGNSRYSCYASNYAGDKPSIFQRSVSNYTTSPACTTYSVSLCTPAPSNGTISASPTTVSPNGYTVVTFTPNSGYMLDAVTVTSGTADEPAAPVYSSGPTSGGTVRINNVSSDITVCATFKAIPLYTVTFVDVDNGNATQTRTQASYGGSVTSPSSSSSSAHDPCDNTWSFVGWAPSNTLSGGTTEPTGFIAAGGTIDGAIIDGPKTYYSVYTNSSDGTTAFTYGKSGTYYFKAITTAATPVTLYATGSMSSNKYPSNQLPKIPFDIQYNSSTTKYTIKNTLTDKYLAPENDNGNNLVERNTSFEWSLEVPDIRGALGNAASGEWFFSYINSASNKRHIYCDGTNFLSKGNGNYDNYALYLEPATSIYYYNASSCTDLVSMTFHPLSGGDPTWADGHPKAEYTDVPKGTISVFPTDAQDGWTFLGWTAGQSYNANREGAGETLDDDNASTTEPNQTIYSTGGNSYNLQADIDMYPVFTKFADNEPFDQFNGGDYYIYYLAPGTNDGYGGAKRVYAATYDGEKRYNSTPLCSNATEFTFTKLANGKWTIYDNKKSKYLGGKNADNWLTHSSTPTEWTISVYSGNEFNATCQTSYQLQAFDNGSGASTATFQNYAAANLSTDATKYHRVYLGSCTERVYSSDPTNTPRVYINGTAKVTSTASKSIKATSALSVSASNISTANITVSSNNSAFKFCTTPNGTYEATVSLAVVNKKVSVTPIYIEYTPAADSKSDGLDNVIVTISDGASPTPTTATTKTGDVQGRHVPANFVIAAKWGDKWYALPANCTESTSSTTGVLIEVDNASDPTRATAAPSYTKWGLQTVRPSRKAEYGTRLVFTEQLTTATADDQKTLYNGSTTSIQANAMYQYYMGDATEKYEWIPTTTDLKDYVLTSATTLSGDASARTVSLSNKGVFGTLLMNKSNDGKVRILPAEFYEPVEMQVIEWKENSLVVMYGGAGIKATTQVGNNDPSSLQTLASAKVDHGVYELSTSQTLTSSTNMPLTITVKNGSDATTGTCALIVPAIVTGAQDAPLGLTADEATLTDVVVTDGATLSAVATKYTFKNITVYPGGKLVIGSGKQLGMASLTLRGGSAWGAATYEHKYPQFVVNNTTSGAYSNTSGVINYDYVTTKDQYYSFVLPYTSNTTNVKYPAEIYGRTLESGSQASFEFQYYDGAARAAGGTGWKVLAEPADLVAGTGYTFLGMPRKVDAYDGTDDSHANSRQRYGIHRIPMSVAAATVQAGETNSAPGKATPISVTLASKNNNSGWALVGNPYLSNVSGLSNQDIQVGKLVHTDTNPWDGKWQWDDTNSNTGVRYIVTTDDGQNFESQQASTATLKAFKNFFVQIQNGDATSLVIPANLRTDKDLAPARYMADVEQDIQLAVDLVSETRSDKVDLLINDVYTAEFDQDGDFTKMMNTTKFNLYGVYPGDNLSFIAVDKTTAAGSIAIGYQVPAAGEYTLQLSDRAYVMTDALEALYVTDHEVSPEVTTDLLENPYSFTVTKAETNDARFTVSIKLKENQDTPTDIDIINGGGDLDGEKPIKFIYHDKMYILRNGVLYDATGKKVREIK